MAREDVSFEERLRAARARQGLDRPAADDHASARQAGFAGTALRSGVEFASAVAVGAGIGYFLDRGFGTRPALTIVFSLLGWVAGMLNVRRALAAMQDDAAKNGKG